MAILCVVLMLCATCAFGQSPILNPSFEDGLAGWTTYTYNPPPMGLPFEPWVGMIDAPGGFDVLIPTPPEAPDGDYVCGTQAWGDSRNGGVYQQFTWLGGPAYITVTGRAFSAAFPPPEPPVPFDNGCRVRMGIVDYFSTNRADVTQWTEFAWSDSWSQRLVTVSGAGPYYTLFIESYHPKADAIMSTIWDEVQFDEWPPVSVIFGPTTAEGDPAHPDTTIRIQWTTDVPSTSRVEYGLDSGYGLVEEDPALVTNHSVLLTDLSPSTQYFFRAISSAPEHRDWVSDEYQFHTSIRVYDVNASVSTDGNGMEISWKTDVPATTQVEYGLDESYGSFEPDPEDPTLTTNHQVTLTNLLEDTEHHFRIWAKNQPLYSDAVSDDYVFHTLPSISQELRNGSFEEAHGGEDPSLYPWVQYDREWEGVTHPIDGLVGPYPQGGPEYWYMGIRAYHGSYFVGASANSDFKNGGVFQRVYFDPGELCTLSARFATYYLGGAEYFTRVAIGIDPNGGIDPDGQDVVWWIGFSPTNDSQWHSASVSTTAGPSGVVTVFLDIRQEYATEWHICALDNALLGPPPPRSVGELKAAESDLGATLENKIVTFVHPLPVGVSGTSYTQGYVQEEDGSSGIAVLFEEGSQSGPPPVVGNKVTVIGSLILDEMEAKVVTDNWSIDPGPYELPDPIGLPHSALGGSTVNQPTLSSSGGPCSVGLRVRVWGKVQWTWFDGIPGLEQEVCIDDGTSMPDGYPEGPRTPGLRVMLAPDPMVGAATGDYLAATGVLTIQTIDPDAVPHTGDEYHTYLVRTSSGEDWNVFTPPE